MESISDILKKSPIFSSLYSEIVSYQIFNVTVERMNIILENELPSCDLILSQPVRKSYRNNEIFSTDTLRKRAKDLGVVHYVVSNCYFTGYDPLPFQITGAGGNIIASEGFSYIPALSLESLCEGDIKRACADWNSIDSFTPEEIEKNLLLTLEELKMREKNIFDSESEIDIKISDFIEENFRKKLLFHTYNHPTNTLLLELAERICRKVGVLLGKVTLDEELLGSYSIPPPPSVYYHMKMTFKYPFFVVKFEQLATKPAMEKYASLIKNIGYEHKETWKEALSCKRNKLSL